MRSQPGNLLVKHLQTLSAAARMDGLPDGELLRCFTERGDEDAFAALVRRHGPMVLRVGQRVLNDAHAAEDVFQATFLVLARKASSLGRGELLGCWLHGVAYRLALKARGQAARRRSRDLRAAARCPGQDPLAEVTVREAQAMVDEELARLPGKLRAPLVLCCLQGQTRDEAAQQLGWSARLVKSRLEQGRERLRARLCRRGLTLPGALLAGLLAEEAAPAAMSAALVRAAASAAGARTGSGVSASAVRLAESALGGMTAGKAKVFAGLLLLAGVLAVGVGAFARPQPAAKEAEPPAARPPELPKAEKQKSERTVRVRVLDPQDKPLPEATVHAGVWTNEKPFKANRDYKTDAKGVAVVELPKTYYILRLWASKKPFVTLFAGWEQNELASGEKVPAEYVFRLEPGVTAGGRIVDERGKPIAGARVQVRLESHPKPAHGDSRVRYNTWLSEGDETATTDADGRWRIANLPDHPQAKLSLLVAHPDYVSDPIWGQAQKAAGITPAQLRKGTATLTLKQGVSVRGRVTGPDGKPIKDALVVHGDDPYSSWLPTKFVTDADGRYRLPALPPRQTTLTVIAPGWAPQMRRLMLEAGMPPQDFRMAPGKRLRLRIVDAAGKPVGNAYVLIQEWKGSKSLYWDHNPNHPKVPDTGIPRRANAAGVWEWAAAPQGTLKVHVGKEGLAIRELEIAAGAGEQTVVLHGKHHVTGRVLDAVTDKPIPSFTVIPLDVFRKDWIVAERGNAVAGKGGRLDFLADRTDVPQRLRVEAEGYRTQDGPEFRAGAEAPHTQDFRLQPSPGITGMVLDPAGRPAAKAEVLLATPTEEIRLESSWGNHTTSTTAAGRFTFPDPGEPFTVVARSGDGFAVQECPAGRHDAGTLRLRPWASVRGRFRDGGRPISGATVLLRPIAVDTLDRPRINANLQATTGPDGRFELSRVPPLAASVRVYLGPWKDEGFRSGPSMPLNLESGQRAEVDLGGGPTVVKGRVKLTGKVPADLDCTYSLNYLVERAPGIAPPPAVARPGFDARKGWQDSWTDTQEGLAYLSTLRHWFVKLAPDGGFRVSGVPPGEYDLAVAVYSKPSGCLVDPLARKVVRVTVTAADAARGEVALPEIRAEVAPLPGVGDVPALTFQKADGGDGKLEDCRGKYTLVHFWASWCGPCKQQLPALRRLQQRFAAGKLATLSLSLDHDAEAWRAALGRLELPWPQGRLATDAAGISSVPAYWLLGPDGKIIARSYDLDELVPQLEKRLK
jgi:RNA polymerase sigma factor (sigma-70 family)